jgi:class 3 adenylate cyclase/tetratricopeptide (TPR) repeat protein
MTGCPNCGAPHDEGQRFCGQCGHPLVEAPVPATEIQPVQERKLATVLFADVVGFTTLAERTDPEIVARMVDSAFRQLGAVVTEHGGTIDKYMGDSLMAVFGVPVSHDDDAERAVAAGLAMRKLGGDLVFSIGINSGEVMATSLGRSGDSTVIGDTVNVAARLEKAAGPGEVLCGSLTVELIGARAVFRPRQAVILKGKREPVEVWEAVALRAADATVNGDEPPLLGRDEELAYLQALWRRVYRDGQAQVTMLCGDAGSGKTRLANELARLAAMDGTVVRATYPAYGAMGGPRVAAEVLRQLGPADDEEIMVRVRSMTGPVDESLQAIDSTGLQKEQLWALARLLEEKSAERPLAIILDDMHRSTETTLDILMGLSALLVRAPLLVLLVGRSEPSEWLARIPSATTVRLAPLAPTDAADLAAAFVCDKPLAPEAAGFLVERAGGNPLYMRELVRMARSQGSLFDDGGCYRLGSAASVPASLQALLTSRLDALGPAAKLVFQHAAVLGDGSTADHIVRLGGAGNAESTLRNLVDGGLLRRSAVNGYDATDPLMREVAYENLPRNIRGDLHRRAAGIVSRSEDRARHLDRAADYLSDDASVTSEAADALADLGEQLARQSRLPDAAGLLERAVALGSRRPSALLALARIHEATGHVEDAEDTLALIADDPHDASQAIERDHAMARAKMFSDPAWAEPRLRQVSVRWREAGDESRAAWAIANAGVANFNLSRMEDAAADLLEALVIFERIEERAGAVAASSFLCLAKPTDRRVPGWLAGALEFADESGDRMKQVSALSALAWHHFLRTMWGGPADTATAEQLALRLAEGAEEVGAIEMAIHGRSLLAIMARWSGRVRLAATHAGVLARHLGPQQHEPWLGWAAGFAVAVAEGASRAAPPFPPASSPDPVAGVASQVIQAELVLAGRCEEAVAHMPAAEGRDHNTLTDAMGMLCALCLVLSGCPEEARPWAEKSLRAARVLEARPTEVAAVALLAEITGDSSALPDAPAVASSVAEALVLRAHAASGDPSARLSLQRAAQSLVAPGLLIGL